MKIYHPLLFILFIFSSALWAEEEKTEEESHLNIYYDQATFLETTDNTFKMKAEIRLQFRISSPFEGNPKNMTELTGADNTDFSVNRSRLKFEGYAYQPRLKYKVEYDFNNATLLDGRVTLWYSKALGFRLGRYKVNYNPERITSSKDLQVVERSMVNDYFTLDRQQGMSLLGRVGEGSFFDSSYSIEIFNGNGRTANNDDGHLLKVARYQWNILGGVIETSMGDLKYRNNAALNVSFAFANNISPYTAFSSSGGKQLPGYGSDENKLYEVDQWLMIVNYKYKGISLLMEYHQKDITGQTTLNEQSLNGALISTGFFPSVFFETIPANLEFAARYSMVDPDDNLANNTLSEMTLAANWFFNKHRNKITLDMGNYDIEAGKEQSSEVRARLQWDISF